MDRDLVNNQIILMRKIVRNVKRLVKQKLHKQIKKLELRLNKQIEKTIKKLENKISNKKKELIAINGVNVDEVSKQALTQTTKYFEDLIKSGKTSVESKALARIAINENVEKVVNKFKEENPNCDQWLPSQIDLWQQKKLIKKNQILKKKALIADNNQTNENPLNSEKQIKQKDQTPNEQHLEPRAKKKTLPNDKNIPKKEKANKAIDGTNTSVIKQNTFEEKKPKLDPFFLSKDSNLDEESEDDSDNNPSKMSHKKSFKNEFTPKEKISKFSKIGGKSHSIQNKKNFKPKKFETRSPNRDSNREKSGSVEDLHPSWAAKRLVQDKLKINLKQRPASKKIKFSDQ